MKKHFHIVIILAGLFCSLPIYAQFDVYNTSPNPDYSSSPENLKKFIRDSIEEHQKTIGNWGTSHKYCLPHMCTNRKGKYALVGFDHRPITPFEFDNISGEWHNNVYLVRKGKFYGCIDTTGKVVVPLNYSQVYLSNPGRLITTGKNGLVFNRKGRVLLPEGYKYLGTLNLGHKTVIKARQEFDDFLTIFDVEYLDKIK